MREFGASDGGELRELGRGLCDERCDRLGEIVLFTKRYGGERVGECGRKLEAILREHHDEVAKLLVEEQRVGSRRVIEREIARLHDDFAAVLNQDSGAREQQADLVEAAAAVGDGLLGAPHELRPRVHFGEHHSVGTSC